MKRPPKLTSTFDEFFAARSRVTAIQIWGLVLIGITIVAGWVLVVAITIAKLSVERLDAADALLLLVPCAIYGAFIYLGVLCIKRAFAGRP